MAGSQLEAIPITDPTAGNVLESMIAAGANPMLIESAAGSDIRFNTRNGEIIASSFFNAHSNACAMLRQSPMSPLAERPIEIPAEGSFVGNALLRIVSESVTRDAKELHNFDFDTKRSGLDVCVQAEETFLRALGHSGYIGFMPIDGEHGPHDIYHDDDGEIVFFRKGLGPPTAISAQDVSLNGITYAKGTLFQIACDKDAESGNFVDRSKKIRLRDIDTIIGLGPLRMSSFAIPATERAAAMRQNLLHPLEKTLEVAELMGPLIPLLEKPGLEDQTG